MSQSPKLTDTFTSLICAKKLKISYQTNEIVVHVSRIPQRCGRRGHDGRHEGVRLLHGGILNVQAIDGNVVQRRVIEHNLQYSFTTRIRWDIVERLKHHTQLKNITVKRRKKLQKPRLSAMIQKN